METGRRLYEVAVAAPLATTLTYAGPIGQDQPLPVGSVVRVPLGGRQVTGYVLGEARPDAGALHKVRPLSEVLGTGPFFPAGLVPFYRWIAQYYHFPVGEVIRTALPLAPGLKTYRRVLVTGLGNEEDILTVAAAASWPWLQRLAAAGQLGSAEVRRLWRNPPERRALLSLEKRGLVRIVSGFELAGGRAKTEAVLQPEGRLAELLGQGGQAPDASCFDSETQPLRRSECKLLGLFCDLAPSFPDHVVPRAPLRQAYPNHTPALQRLVARGLLSLHQRAVLRDPFAGLQRRPCPIPDLTAAQKSALASMSAAIRAHEFVPFLLFGVTGSGKTEVYLQALDTALALGRSALILVPEITLAAQLERDLHARFGELVAVLHSGMSDGERIDQWQLVLHGQARVVLGARSAVFAPLADLGLVIVDEEHDSSYKQEEGLPYQGRDLAVLRAQLAGCPVVLGSATPALTSYWHTQTGKYQLLHLPARVNPQPLPQVSVVDMKAGQQPSRLFSVQLLAAMRETLAQKQQTLLFLNRRGFATFMQCPDCGHVLECRHCHVALTLHRAQNRLLCHYCGYQLHPDTVCPACGSHRMLGRGFGTERIEEEIAAFFPEARTVRVDSDNKKNRRTMLELMQAMRSRDIDILIGTQIIAKGLHFPHVALVGVLWADAGLSLPDFRAGERTFAQLVQVTGRAGRGETPGRVIIQTCRPDHYAVRLAQQQDYVGLYAEEIELRRQLAYPPLTRLVNVRLSGEHEAEVERGAGAVAAFLRRKAGPVVVLGPAPAPLVKIKDRVRWQLLLKSSDLHALHALCNELCSQKHRLCPRNTTLQVDVDPENML